MDSRGFVLFLFFYAYAILHVVEMEGGYAFAQNKDHLHHRPGL
jgi:hypothetical protein